MTRRLGTDVTCPPNRAPDKPMAMNRRAYAELAILVLVLVGLTFLAAMTKSHSFSMAGGAH